MPVGDIQHGAQGADLGKFGRHLLWGMNYNAYFTGLGDYLDVASPSGRDKWNHAQFYDSVKDAMDKSVLQSLDEMKRVLEPTQGRWIVLNRGHHYWRFQEEFAKENGLEADTDRELAKFLGCTVADGVAISQLKFSGEHGKHAVHCQIWQTHGEGSGITMAAPLNKLERQMSRFPTVDIFLIGHYSRKVGYPVDVQVPVFGKHPRMVAKRRILACTGGFVRSYEVGPRPSYVEKALMPPTNLGGVVIYARPVHSHDEDRLDLGISQ